MRKNEFVHHLREAGWERDQWGNYHKLLTFRTKQGDPVIRKVRCKVGDLSCRVELPSQSGTGKRTWLYIGGGYFRDVVKLPDGRLRIGSFFFG